MIHFRLQLYEHTQLSKNTHSSQECGENIVLRGRGEFRAIPASEVPKTALPCMYLSGNFKVN